MATLFIFISFILNAVALFAIILLFMRQNRLHEIKKEQEKLVADMEEMMTAYLAEMKEENEKLIKEFSSSSPAEHSAAAGQASSAVTPGKSAPPAGLQRALGLLQHLPCSVFGLHKYTTGQQTKQRMRMKKYPQRSRKLRQLHKP